MCQKYLIVAVIVKGSSTYRTIHSNQPMDKEKATVFKKVGEHHQMVARGIHFSSIDTEDAALGKLLNLLDTKVEQRGGQIITVGRFFPSSKTCHACRWKWEDMQLSDRIFICQNLKCAYHHFEQDRDHNASLNILREALRLIGLIDQVVTGIGSDEDANLAVDAG